MEVADGVRQGSALDHLSAIWTHMTFFISALCSCFGGARALSPRAEPAAKPMLLPKRLPAINRQPAGILMPNGPYKERWDLFVMVLVLYSAFFVPLRVCFEARAPPLGAWWSLEVFISVMFLLDVILGFNTALQIEGVWVYDRPTIARHYFSGWFWIDFPSALPVELLELFLEKQQHIENLATLRFLRMFRLVRLLRLLKIREYATRSARGAFLLSPPTS